MRELLIVMNKNKKSADIWYDFETKTVKYTNYEPQPLLRAFLTDTPTWRDFREFLESRCVTKDRVNLREILDDLNLPFYDPWLYIKKTRGLVLRDKLWLRFGEKDVDTWENVSREDYTLDENYINSLTDSNNSFFGDYDF